MLNAIVHKDYSSGIPIQISVYENKIVMWNPATLPEGWTQVTLLGPHQSQPPNPDIANPFFRTGEIEAWGRGIERIFAACESRSFSVFLVHTKPRRHEGLKEKKGQARMP